MFQIRRIKTNFAYILLVGATLLASQFLWAKEIQFVQPQSNNELVQNSAVSITQDNKGYIWIATLAGLHKYDGYQYTALNQSVWKNVPDAEWLWSLHIDSKGYLWVGSLLGQVYRVNIENGSIEDLTLSFNPDHFSQSNDTQQKNFGGTVTKFYESNTGKIWVASTLGLAIYDPESGSIEHQPELSWQVKAWKNIADIQPAHDGKLWIGHDRGLSLIDENKGIIRQYSHDSSDPSTLSGNDISRVFPDKGYVWVGTLNHGLSRLNLTSDKFERFMHASKNDKSLGSDQINYIYRDSSQRLWIATNGAGLDLFHDDTKTFTHFRKSQNSVNGIPNNKVISIFEDQSGVLWFGTNGGGIIQINPSASRFSSLKRMPFAPNSLSDDFIWDLAVDSADNIWIATLSGLDRFNRTTKEIKTFKPTNLESLEFESLDINAIAFDNEKVMWLGLTSGQYLLFDPKTEKFQFISHPSLELPNNNNRVWVIKKDRQGGLFLSSLAGTYYLNTTEQRNLKEGKIEPLTQILPFQTRVIFEDYYGNYWLGSSGKGLYVFDHEFNQIAHFLNQPRDPKTISDNTIRSIYQDTEKGLWIGTISGLNYLTAEHAKHLQEEFKRYSTKDGLANNTIYAILPDNRNNLWIATNKGLSRFTPVTKEFTNYDKRDGLINNEFNGGADLKLADGTIMFGGVEGLVYFQPNTIKSNPNQPKTVLTEFKVNNTAWPNPYSLETLQKIKLDYTESNLEFSFAAMDYSQPLKNQFRYRMLPIENEWIYAETERHVKYPNLRDGQYLFQVQGSNNDGLWSAEIRELDLTITPPWWRHPLAYFFYACLVLLLFVLQQSRQNKKLKEEQRVNAELERVNRLKDEFLANTSHELRTPLNGIIGLSESLLSSKKNDLSQMVLQSLRMIKNSGERLASLVDNILDMTRLKQDKLKLQLAHVDLHSAVDSVITQSTSLLNSKQITLANNIEPQSLAVYADHQRFIQILQNLVFNAIKFTKSGSIVISAYQELDTITICVADTGIGIKESRLEQIFEDFTQADGSNSRDAGGVGLGLSICRRLVNMHQGQIWVNSQPNSGSQFYFTMPVGVWELVEQKNNDIQVDVAIDESEIDSHQDKVKSNSDSNMPYVLVVDDEPVNRMVLRSHLKKKSYQVDIAEDGLIALAKIEQQEYDLIILDVMMPGMTGIEVCQKLRKTHSLTSLPILMVSAKTQKEDITEGINAGANDYITKPIETSEFYARVSSLLGLRELEQVRHERDKAKELAKANQELALHYAQIDQVTLIPNRSSLIETFPKILREARLTKHSVLLALISLDRFKQVNESYGHLLGDRILHHLANQINQQAKSDGGFAARIGSDEFAILVPVFETGPSKILSIQESAKQLLSLINHPIHFEEPSIVIKASIGLSIYPDHAQTQMDLLRMADLAMIAAKKRGGNQAECYSADKTKNIRGNLNMESKIRFGLNNNEFIVYTQPLVESHNKALKSAEALVRWAHPKGMIFPDRFIPVAENCGLIIELGKHVLRQVCQYQRQWLDQEYSPCPIAINVSMIQITRSNFVKTLEDALTEFQLDPDLIELEVTESAMTENMEQFKSILLELKAIGVKLAIDDFGTGFSSLSYLKELPVDKLKIDRSFINDITQSKQSRNIVASVIKLAHELSLEVVSEGVEDDLALQLLRNMGCDTIQGYLIARPFPITELVQWFPESQATSNASTE
jgi:two-component system, sensor histidine kinase ChiS